MIGRQFTFVCAAQGGSEKAQCLLAGASVASLPGLWSLLLLPVFSEDYFPLGSASKAAELFTQSTIFFYKLRTRCSSPSLFQA